MPKQTTWSTTAADNDDADLAAGIQWTEGMFGSQVNNSARAQMAEEAKFLRDTNGSIATAGSSTVITATGNGSFTALADGLLLTLTATTTCGASPTLNVTQAGTALGAKKIRKFAGSAEADLSAGDWLSGAPGEFVYKTAANSSAGAWVMLNPTVPASPDAMPVGMIVPYAGTSAPTKFLFCYGQAVSRTTYSALFAALSTTYGTGDGSTTFNLPDLRGRAPFGKDDMGGTAASRITNAVSGITATTLGATGGDQRMQSHDHDITHGNSGTPTSGTAGVIMSSTNNGTASTATEGAGSSQNMPPALILNYIVYAGV